jgi:two-component system OmpR family response regulator
MERTPHILVVDDDREICSLVSQFLSRHSLRVSTARDGIEMFKALEAARIDLIVLDLMMPGEDGLSLCRRLRAGSTTPVIMLTAMGEDIDRIVGLEMGADDYLPKPFNPRELLARIKAVLRRVEALPPITTEPTRSSPYLRASMICCKLSPSIRSGCLPATNCWIWRVAGPRRCSIAASIFR